MPRLHCSLPNASDEISGIKFVSHADGGKVSVEISESLAADMATIPGYSIVQADKGTSGAMTGESGSVGASVDAENKKTEDDDIAALRARGVELSIPHAAQMGAKRLREAIADAGGKAKRGSTD